MTTLSLPLTLLTELYCAAIRGLSHLPFAPVYASTRPDPLLLLCAALLGALALLYWRDRRGVAALCVLLSCPHFTTNPTPGSAPRMTLLAVGHGHAALLHLRQQLQCLVWEVRWHAHDSTI